MIELPTLEQWVQRNRGDMLGNLQATFNIDFTKVLGKTRTTRMLETTANFDGVPVRFKAATDGLIYTQAGRYMYHTAGLNTRRPFVQDSGTGTPNTGDSLYTDIEFFNGKIYGSTYEGGGDRIFYGDSTGWNYITGLGTQTGPHMLTHYPNLQMLYVTIATQSKIYSVNTSNSLATSGANTLAFDFNLRPVFILAGPDRLWIGMMAFSGKGFIFEWDGVTTQPTRLYRLEASGVWAGIIKDGVPWVVDSNGRLLQFSNGVFNEVARFPIQDKLLANATNMFNNNRPVHPNGMSIVNGKINILFNNLMDDGSSIEEFCPSGIWEYDDIIYNPYTGSSQGAGLYHKYSLSYTPIGSNTITDYGQNKLSIIGGLSEMKNSDTNAAATGNLLAGAQIFNDASATANASFTNDTFEATSGTTGQYNTPGAGYLVTTKQYAIDEKGNTSIQNTWENVYTLYQKLLTASSKIKVKYRVLDNVPLYATITWTSTTTFTTTTNVLTLEGQEVEVLQGVGSGLCSHITLINLSGSTYTVTVDETYTGATGTAKIRIQNWIKISDISQSGATVDQAGTGPLSNWVQYKICMIFAYKDELERIIITNQNTYQPK